jgi:hypothetical protein
MIGNHELSREFARVVNSHSRENAANIPDYIVGDYLVACLEALEQATVARDDWFGIKPRPGAQPPMAAS